MRAEKKHKYSLEDLKTQQERAAMCASAELPGANLRELIRLAIVGWKFENPETHKVVQQ